MNSPIPALLPRTQTGHTRANQCINRYSFADASSYCVLEGLEARRIALESSPPTSTGEVGFHAEDLQNGTLELDSAVDSGARGSSSNPTGRICIGDDLRFSKADRATWIGEHNKIAWYWPLNQRTNILVVLQINPWMNYLMSLDIAQERLAR